MKQEQVILKQGETKTVGDLTVTNSGGGHKILRGEGDISFAELTLSTPRQKEEIIRIMPKDQESEEAEQILFDDYRISAQSIQWNGEVVELSISYT